MFKKIHLNNLGIILLAVFLFAAVQLSYADGNSFTVNVPNGQGGYVAVVIQQSGGGYAGPQGEYYPQFPSVAQLQAMYGNGAPNPTPQVTVVTIPPPALPVYVQPDPPDSNYIWTPGYWRYDYFFQDYYWVPGTWVLAPTPGYLWTPGYWGWSRGHFVFNDGYWGVHIGFYGGINYGHGYGGRGFSGGGWNNGTFVNRRVNETNITINITNNNSSFNGGAGGVQAQPTSQERAAMHERHVPATAEQKIQVQAARKNPALRASANHGKPAIAATARPGVFKGKGVVAAKRAGAFYNKTKPRKSGASRNIKSATMTKHVAAMHQNKNQTHPQTKAKAKVKPKAKAKPKAKPKPKPKPKAPPEDNSQNKNS